MSLVRVSEGDGLVTELPKVTNKSLTPIPITLVFSPFYPSTNQSNQASRVRFGPKPAGRVRTDSGVV